MMPPVPSETTNFSALLIVEKSNTRLANTIVFVTARYTQRINCKYH
ncbi:MAG: hypothetical protein OFPI_17270 [Osedax symbiont Rs2]|nr:MAG: hypothetical protein OFPI_17270 [Osedax symbiont Rs2]